jgi:hypothetical protein
MTSVTSRIRSVDGVAHRRYTVLTRWLEGYECDGCREAQNDAARARFRRRAQARLPLEVRPRLLDAIHAGQPFQTALRELRLTPNQVWGLIRRTWSGQALSRPH